MATDGVLSSCARERVSLFIAHSHRAAIALTTHCRVASDAGAIQCWSENIVYGFDGAMIKALTLFPGAEIITVDEAPALPTSDDDDQDTARQENSR